MPQRGDTLRLLQIVRATKDETLSDCEKLSVVSYSMLASTTLEANKELVKNKFPISCACRNGTIVPLGQVIIKENFQIPPD
jgi:hypothetical protein